MLRPLFFLVVYFVYSGLSAQNFIKKFNSVSNITAVGTKVFFVADDDVNGTELWITDGTPEGTKLVKDIAPGFTSSSPSYLISYNGQLFFTAFSPQFGNEVWKSDGTNAGTVLLTDIYAGDGNGSDPRSLTLYNNELYFDASPDGFNRSIYRSNGSGAGTAVLKDMGFGEVTDIEVAGNYLYFVFGIGKLWRTNGTSGGTVEVPVDSYFYVKRLTAVGTQLFFTTSYTENVNVRLYALSGVSAPAMLKEFSAPVSSTNELANFTAVGSRLFFSVRKDYDQQSKTDELWWSDGTSPGTSLVKSFAWDPTTSNSAMKNFFSFSNSLYFQNGSSEDDAWWKSDGTDQGTVEVSSVRLGYPSLGSAVPVLSNGNIFMSGEGELWISDGTTSGTKEYYDINQSYSSSPTALVDVNNLLYFAANDGYGEAIWNIAPSGEIDVHDPSMSSIISGGSLGFETTLTNDCSSKIIEIQNVGAKELILSDIVVTGKDFYIAGQLPAILKPNEKVPVSVYFLPFSTGTRTGTLTIRSNDVNESSYIIQLSGTGDAGTATTFCDAYEGNYLKKNLVAGTQSTVIINKNTILENQSVGTIVGSLSAPGSGNTFSLVIGEGDADNNKFYIDANALKSQAVFDFSTKNIYSVRVKAQNGSGSAEGQLTIYVLEIPSNSLPASECLPLVTRINSGLQDAEYNASGHLFVCGEGGKLIRSTDGGTTWTALNSGVNVQLTKMVFKGTSGYAAGDGVLLKSEDNGDTWSQLFVSSNTAIAPKTVFFLDADVGFVAGLNGEILKTINGGVSWTSQGQKFPNAPTSLYFWNEEQGIACTSFGSVHKTSDGGQTWTIVDTSNLENSNLFTNITFLDNNVGFMTSLTHLFTSNDGGLQWTEVAGISGVYFQEVRFVTSNIGYVIGGYPSSELFMSMDGGINWDVVPSSPLSAGRGIGYFGGGSNKVVIVGANTPDLSSTEPGSVIMSATAGTSVWDIKHELHSEDFYSVSFPSATTGYAAGSEDVYKTTNGGTTWKKLNLQKPVYDVFFLDALNGYLADGFSIYSTTNGGSNWNLEFTSGSANLKQVIALSGSVVLAYSESGVIYKDNGTSSWPVVFNQPLNQLQQIHFPSATVGYGVDLLGKVIKTTNGGSNWSVIYTHAVPGESFNTIYFFDASNGLMAGGNGVLYKTVNGGANWTKVFSGIQAGIKRMIFEDGQVGYAFTDQGTVFRSENGGQTWFDWGVLPFTGLLDVSKSGTKVFFCGQWGSLGKLEAPKAPTRPGFISGDQLVCDGDAVEYAVAADNNLHYYWSISGATLTSNNGQASVQFNGAGQYNLSVQHYTACGTSATRTLSVTVNDPPQPEILGPQVVDFNSTVQFTINGPAPLSIYSWDVTGAKSFTANGPSAIDVTWGKDPGDVVVMETTASGCRAKDTKSVSIDPSTIVGIPDANIIEAGVRVYPNPTSDHVIVESNLSAELEIRVYNLMGQEYHSKALHPFESNDLNFLGMPKGLYLVEISAPGGKSKTVKKIIRN